MGKEKAMDALKGAILLEIRGKSLYESFAENAEDGDVKELFAAMADEEDTHITVLGEHMKELDRSGNIGVVPIEDKSPDFSSKIISDRIKENIGASGSEAAAISAAMALEEKAVDFYREKRDEAEGDAEIKLYDWLAKWEESHLQYLAELDEELTKKVWLDNKFWPIY